MELTLEQCKRMMEENGGYLYLEGCTGLTSLPDGLTVGGSLYLEGCTGLTSLPDGLTVGGSLYLNGCTGLTSLPDGLTVGGYLYLNGCTGLTSAEKRKARAAECSLKNGTYSPNRFIFCDGILTHVRREKKIGNYIYYIGKIKNKNVIFDGDHYAHCKNFSSGVIDLNFKKAKDRGADQYKAYTLESVVTMQEAVSMYRIITGACQAGTEQFISGLKELKKEYSIKEIIEITKGHYGAAWFESFFKEE